MDNSYIYAISSGNITYEVEIIPLAGGDIYGATSLNKTFIIDP